MSGSSAAPPRLIVANRNQLIMEAVDVEKLIPDDHAARAIWEFVGKLDLTSYEMKIKSLEGGAGRPAYDPRLLISVWIYAYSDGEGSAREIEKLCTHDPAYRWLTGLEVINHHTLSDFRIDHKEELDELFTQVLGVLTAANLVTLKRVTQDGTKVKARASSSSFRREATIQSHLAEAAALVAEMGDPRRAVVDGVKREKTRERALKERKERLEKALEELPKIRARKKNEEARKEARVSETDPDARIMKQGGGGFAPSYNVQLSVDAEHGIIVDVDVSQIATDTDELPGAMERVEERTGAKPLQVVADNGYTNNTTVMAMDKTKIDFIGSIRDTSSIVETRNERRGIEPGYRKEAFQYNEEANLYVCPAGKELLYKRMEIHPGTTHHIYRASAGSCGVCPHQKECHPYMKAKGRAILRVIEEPAITRFNEKMATEEAKAAYKTRSQTAEFPNAWIKEKIGLRQFRTRGKERIKQEALFASITYNIQQWIRLIWRPQLATNTG